jgi:hypothetical protein
MNTKRWGLLSLSFFCFSVIFYFAVDDRAFATDVYGYVTYYLITALFFVWANYTFRYLRAYGPGIKEFVKSYGITTLSALVISGVVAITVPAKFRVLSDETNLVSVSRAMAFHKTVFNNTMGKSYFGMFHPISYELEKRPMMYPYFTHILHHVRGYTIDNAFLINLIFFFCLLAGVGIVCTRWISPVSGIAAQLLITSYPLVTLVSRSGGFDLMASVWVLIVFACLREYFKKQDSDSLTLLWVNLLLMAHIRYESAIFIVVVGAGVIGLRYFKLNQLVSHFWIYVLSPFFLLPLVIQRILIPSPYENTPGTPAFSFDYFVNFTSLFLNSQTKMDWMGPHAVVLNWVALVVSVILVYFFSVKKREVRDQGLRHTIWIFSAAIVSSLLIFFFYYFGNYTHPASARFFLNVSILAALAPVALRALGLKWWGDRRLLVMALMSFLFHHSISVHGWYTQVQNLIRETDYGYAFIEKLPHKNVLLIHSRPGQYTVLGIGAVDFGWANVNKDSILLELDRKLYEEVYVFQRITYDPNTMGVPDPLDPAFQLETLRELQTSASETVRISRVKKKSELAAIAPPAPSQPNDPAATPASKN